MSLQLLTVQQHILEEQRRRYPDASGEFSWLLSGITLATKIVAAQVRRAGLAGILGVTLTGMILDATGSWQLVFLISAGIYIVGAIVWLLFATGERVFE